MKPNDTHTLSILVANKPGVLVRVALVFARRGYNIDSLVVSPVHNPKFSRMTITAKGDPTILEQIIKQVNKLIDVIHASEHDTSNAVDRELSLLKVKATPAGRAIVIKHAREKHAQVMDETDGLMILAHTGSTEELDALEALMTKYGLVEVVRTGKLLMIKGKETT
ncbi:MAG: acetolactate synthase small subunit [Candidatus Omnitrophica bacterium]|nr:acetolactate synthase small subunit [Candidatus Omnitrophota bacterium]